MTDMNKRSILTKTTVILFLLTTMIGCTGKRKELSENVVKEFFTAVKNGNESKMTDLYPDFLKVGTYYKSDEILIKETKAVEDKKVVVTIENSFTNGFGKKFNQTMTLFLKPFDEEGNIYKIHDSKGLTGFDEKDEYKFAVNTGCIDKNADLTDQEVAQKLETANLMMVELALDVMKELRDQVKVASWSWKSGYGGSASGQGIVNNNSDFSIPSLKYKITYYDRNDNQITTDDGYVSYDKLNAGYSKSFTFYTSYVGNASSATISLDFDTEMVLKYIVNKDYNGNECAEFQSRK
jgi:hypothetical protein